MATVEDPRSPALRRIERGVEERIRAMIEAGDLSGLPGEGKPFPKDDEPTDDRWAARHVLKNERAIPAWAELRREIDASLAALVARTRRHLDWVNAREAALTRIPSDRVLETDRATRQADERARTEIAEALAELNGLVRRYELAAPVASLQIAPFTVERIFALAATRSSGPER